MDPKFMILRIFLLIENTSFADGYLFFVKFKNTEFIFVNMV